jgi:hypothetical protein
MADDAQAGRLVHLLHRASQRADGLFAHEVGELGHLASSLSCKRFPLFADQVRPISWPLRVLTDQASPIWFVVSSLTVV